MAEKQELTGQAKGGVVRAERLSPEERREIARKAALARWDSDLPKATHEGVLKIGDIKIPCAVLEDGQRLLTLSGLMQALGRARQAKGRAYYRDDDGLPVFMAAQNLKPFISRELRSTSSYIEFRPIRGPRAFGFKAEILPKLCDMFIDADESGALTKQQEHIAVRAKILMRGLAHVGIIALVDEATGYEKVRDQLALQAILDRYLRKEFAAWAKRFPDEFYREIFRLREWKWPPIGMRTPRAVGKYTQDLVYARLAPDLLKELEKKNPKNERGNRKAKHHQWLTEDVGHPALAQHLHAVIALMRASRSWPEFKRMIDRSFPRRTRLDDLPLFNPPAGLPSGQ